MDKNLALLERLADFSLDEPDSSFPFSAKLSQECGWTREFTARAIEEYKRFCYLAVVAGHPVSPSDVVDQVWHLHLTYSYNYWKVFCADILQTPFHHHPSKGGIEEHSKFQEWTAKTLASYQEAFGSEPPVDIWMAAKPKPLDAHVRFDGSQHYIVRKSAVKAIAQGLALATGIFVLAGCTESMTGNPLDMRGPDFLQFYVLLFGCTFAGGWFARNLLRLPIGGSEQDLGDLHPYFIAYLNGRGVLAVNTAITSLIARNIIELDPKLLKVKTVDSTFVTVNPVETLILKTASVISGAYISSIRARCQTLMYDIHLRLVDRGLLVDSTQAKVATAAGIVVSLLAPSFGLIKIMVGISRGRPVFYLETLCVLSVLATLIFFVIKPFRSRKGDRVLGLYQSKQAHLRTVGQHTQQASVTDIALGCALFGTAALVGSPYHAYAKALTPPVGSTSCGGSSASSSSNSGCGGGGCGGGGGGCGGCSG